jgi:hypothetical protein
MSVFFKMFDFVSDFKTKYLAICPACHVFELTLAAETA